MKLKLTFAAAALLLGACAHAPLPGSVKAAPEPLTAEGSCPFNSRDLAASRACAVLGAQRNAVLRVADMYLDETSLAEKSAVLENKLLKTPNLYVAKYKTVSEGQDGSFYKVNLKAWVYHGRIASELRALNLSGAAAAGPRAALAQRGVRLPAFTAAFKEAFAKRSALSIEDLPSVPEAAAADGDESLEAAAAAGFDLLLSVSAGVSLSGAGLNTGFYPSRADAAVKVYEASTGKLLLELSEQANGMDSTEAGSFSKALAAVGELLAQATASRAERLLKPDGAVKLNFYGLDGLAALERLKAQLLRLDLKGLRLESYSSGTAVFRAVPRRSDPQELASAVLRGDSMGLELEGAAGQEISFSVPE